MPNSKYQDEALKLVTTRSFDINRANVVIEGITDPDQTIVAGEFDYHSTLMREAVRCNNLEAVLFLLEHGSDPNYISEDCDSPLFDLQYGPYNEPPEEDEIRYKIAKLFFEHGADPNLLVEGETIYDQVTFDIFNEPDLLNWDYSIKFYKLLVLYGGGGHTYGKPEFSEPIDFSRVDDYQIRLQQHEDGYHVEGHLLNPDGKDIGIL